MFFAEADRLIYSTPGGAKFDPLAVHRALVQSGAGKLNQLLEVWAGEGSGEVERAVAEDRLVAVARAAFGLKPFDQPGGATDAEVLALLEDFLRWIEGKDLRGSSRPVSPPLSV